MKIFSYRRETPKCLANRKFIKFSKAIEKSSKIEMKGHEYVGTKK